MGARRVLSSRGEHPAAVRRGARHRGRAARASSRGGASGRRTARGAPGDGALVPGPPVRAAGDALRRPRGLTVPVRLVSYNIRFGGEGRLAFLGAVLAHLEPDVVLLQEATDPIAVDRIARAAGLGNVFRRPDWSVAALTREPPDAL